MLTRPPRDHCQKPIFFSVFFCFVLLQGVIQRSYNAYAVRVRDTNPVPTPGRGFGGLVQGADKGGGTLKIVPANETTHGVLCIEMRIRLYSDGAMSKLLENLAKVRR